MQPYFRTPVQMEYGETVGQAYGDNNASPIGLLQRSGLRGCLFVLAVERRQDKQVIQACDEDFLLGLKIELNPAAAHLRFLDDILHRRRFVAFANENANRSVQYLLPPLHLCSSVTVGDMSSLLS